MRGRTATIFSVKALEKKSKSTPSIRQDHSLMYVICRALFLLLLSFLSFLLFFFFAAVYNYYYKKMQCKLLTFTGII